jgi:hypothetical protein
MRASPSVRARPSSSTAWALRCERIVSKRIGSSRRSGWIDHWLKTKNPASAVRHEAEED